MVEQLDTQTWFRYQMVAGWYQQVWHIAKQARGRCALLFIKRDTLEQVDITFGHPIIARLVGALHITSHRSLWAEPTPWTVALTMTTYQRGLVMASGRPMSPVLYRCTMRPISTHFITHHFVFTTVAFNHTLMGVERCIFAQFNIPYFSLSCLQSCLGSVF